MVYKKYIKRGGKIYGPYYYHSRRVNGKVVSEYKGGVDKKIDFTKYKKYSYPVLGIFLFAIFAYVFVMHGIGGNVSGNAVLELGANYQQGQPLNGLLKIPLNNGEMIPASSEIIINSESNEYSFPLNEVINSSLINNGQYYLSSSNINGSGEGYGFIGAIDEYPLVYFKLKIYPNNKLNELDIQTENPSENLSESSNSDIIDDVSFIDEENDSSEIINLSDNTTTEETPEEVITKETTAEETTAEETPTEETTEEAPPEATPEETLTEETTAEEITTEETLTEEISTTEEIPEATPTEETAEETTSPGIGSLIANFFLSLTPTGNVVSDSESTEIIEGSVSYGENFSLKIPKGYTAAIIPDSVRTENINLSSSDIKLLISSNKIIITTDYKETKSGFGKEYSNTGKNYLFVNLSKLNLNLDPGKLKVSVVFNNNELISTTTNLIEEVSVSEKNDSSEKIEQPSQETQASGLKGLPSNLTSQEQAILNLKFKDQPINVNKALESGNKIKIKYELGDYWFEGTYDASLSKEALSSQLNEDKTKWLKDVASELLRKEPTNTPLTELIGNYTR